MTRGEKAAQTAHRRKERERDAWRARLDDRDKALSICRKIRDDENALDADRLTAIQIIHDYTEENINRQEETK